MNCVYLVAGRLIVDFDYVYIYIHTIMLAVRSRVVYASHNLCDLMRFESTSAQLLTHCIEAAFSRFGEDLQSLHAFFPAYFISKSQSRPESAA